MQQSFINNKFLTMWKEAVLAFNFFPCRLLAWRSLLAFKLRSSGYGIVCASRNLPTVQKNILPPFCTLNILVAGSSESLITTMYQTTWCHSSADHYLISRLLGCDEMWSDMGSLFYLTFIVCDFLSAHLPYWCCQLADCPHIQVSSGRKWQMMVVR